ncbi:uncharacterized protein LOC117898167 [Drosophila subobscura]|uniref:uncharacterized protein LOC117898167 n=1 Tax=Drosophila subobscura TaxID=7241 RepID=UPI00155A8DD5|nr:uncharacterized protein LOC117898167 [Drosophila subobscura]
MNRHAVLEWLIENNIEFDQAATFRQLRQLAMANGVDLMELPGEENKNMEVKSDGPEISPDAQARRLEAERLMIEAEISLLQRKQALEELRKGSKEVMQIMEPYAGKVNSAHAWMEEFELNCKGTDAFKIRCVRHLMKAETDAELFLKVNKATSYAAFKKEFLDTFGRISSIVEVINTLKSTQMQEMQCNVLRSTKNKPYSS